MGSGLRARGVVMMMMMGGVGCCYIGCGVVGVDL